MIRALVAFYDDKSVTELKFALPLAVGDEFVVDAPSGRQICKVGIVLHCPVNVGQQEAEPTVLYAVTRKSMKAYGSLWNSLKSAAADYLEKAWAK